MHYIKKEKPSTDNSFISDDNTFKNKKKHENNMSDHSVYKKTLIEPLDSHLNLSTKIKDGELERRRKTLEFETPNEKGINLKNVKSEILKVNVPNLNISTLKNSDENMNLSLKKDYSPTFNNSKMVGISLPKDLNSPPERPNIEKTERYSTYSNKSLYSNLSKATKPKIMNFKGNPNNTNDATTYMSNSSSNREMIIDSKNEATKRMQILEEIESKIMTYSNENNTVAGINHNNLTNDSIYQDNINLQTTYKTQINTKNKIIQIPLDKTKQNLRPPVGHRKKLSNSGFTLNKEEGYLFAKNTQIYNLLKDQPDQPDNQRRRVMKKMQRLSTILLSKNRSISMDTRKLEDTYHFSKFNNSRESKSSHNNPYYKDFKHSNKLIRMTFALLKSRGTNYENLLLTRSMRYDKGGVVDFYMNNMTTNCPMKYEVKKASRDVTPVKDMTTNLFKKKRFNLNQREPAAKIIQKWWRNIITLYQITTQKIVRIQSFYRGHWLRSYLFDLVYSRHLIQLFFDKISKPIISRIKKDAMDKLIEAATSKAKKTSELLKLKNVYKTSNISPEVINLSSEPNTNKTPAAAKSQSAKRCFKLYDHFRNIFWNRKFGQYFNKLRRIAERRSLLESFSVKLIEKLKAKLNKKNLVKKFYYWMNTIKLLNQKFINALNQGFPLLQSLNMKRMKHFFINLQNTISNNTKKTKKIIIISKKKISKELKSNEINLKLYFYRWRLNKSKILYRLKIIKSILNSKGMKLMKIALNKWKLSSKKKKLFKSRKQYVLKSLKVIYSKNRQEIKKNKFDKWRNVNNKFKILVKLIPKSVSTIVKPILKQAFKLVCFKKYPINNLNKIREGVDKLIGLIKLKQKFIKSFVIDKLKQKKYYDIMRKKLLKNLLNHLNKINTKLNINKFLKWKSLTKHPQKITLIKNVIEATTKLQNFYKQKFAPFGFSKLKNISLVNRNLQKLLDLYYICHLGKYLNNWKTKKNKVTNGNPKKGNLERLILKLTNDNDIKKQLLFLFWKNKLLADRVNNAARVIQKFFNYILVKRNKLFDKLNIMKINKATSLFNNIAKNFLMKEPFKKIIQESNRRILIKFFLFMRNKRLRIFLYAFKRIKNFAEVKTFVLNACAKKIQDRFKILKNRFSLIKLLNKLKKLRQIMSVFTDKNKSNMNKCYKYWKRIVMENKWNSSSQIIQNYTRKKIEEKKQMKKKENRILLNYLFNDYFVLRQFKPFLNNFIISEKIRQGCYHLRRNIFYKFVQFSSNKITNKNFESSFLILNKFIPNQFRIPFDRIKTHADFNLKTNAANKIQKQFKSFRKIKRENNITTKLENIYIKLTEKQSELLKFYIRKWLSNCQVDKIKNAALTITNFVAERLANIKSRRKWRDFINKFGKKYEIQDSTQKLKSLYKIRKMSGNLSNFINNLKKLVYYKIINYVKESRKCFTLFNLFSHYLHKEKLRNLKYFFLKWKNKTASLSKKETSANIIRNILLQKQVKLYPAIVFDLLKFNKLKLQCKRILLRYSLRKIKRRGDNKKKISNLCQSLIKAKTYIERDFVTNAVNKIYCLFIYKILAKLFNITSKKIISLHRRQFMRNLIKNSMKDYFYQDKITQSSMRKENTKKLKFCGKTESRKTYFKMTNTRDTKIYVAPYLNNLLNKILNDKFLNAFNLMKTRSKGSKLNEITTRLVNNQLLVPKQDFLSKLHKNLEHYTYIKSAKSFIRYLGMKVSLINMIKCLHPVGKLLRFINFVRVTNTNLQLAKSKFIRKIIRKWRFYVHMKNLSKAKLNTLYKNMHLTYLNTANELINEDDKNYGRMQFISSFDKSHTSQTTNNDENDLYSKLTRKYKVDHKISNIGGIDDDF